MIYDRMQYLNEFIFDTPQNRAGALKDDYLNDFVIDLEV